MLVPALSNYIRGVQDRTTCSYNLMSMLGKAFFISSISSFARVLAQGMTTTTGVVMRFEKAIADSIKTEEEMNFDSCFQEHRKHRATHRKA